MEQVEEMRKTYKEREQEREYRINKMGRQLVKIYDRLLSIDMEIREIRKQNRIKEIEKETKELNAEKSYLENDINNMHMTVRDDMNWFNERE